MHFKTAILAAMAMSALFSRRGPAATPRAPTESSDSLPGSVIPRATAGFDTAQTFAVYLPAGYPGKKQWPALFVLDPRGRAMFALGLFAPSAERNGFVVISSYNSLSDGPVAPNIGAINAMLAEAQERLAVDITRLYIAGFSGTARLGWDFALEAPQNFAGLISASAPNSFTDSVSMARLRRPDFALAVTAGTNDFNWVLAYSAERQLMRNRVSARVDFFDGPHAWPPTALIDRAVRWLRLQGMLSGRWEADTSWLREEIAAEERRGDSLAAASNLTAAADTYDQLATQLTGRKEAVEVQVRARALNTQPSVVAMRRHQAELAEKEVRWAGRSDDRLEELRTSAVRDPASIASSLEIPTLKKTAATGDSLERPWATRLLARDAVSLGFYEPTRYLELRQPERAVEMLRTFALISPWNASHCDLLRQAVAQMPESERSSAEACPLRPLRKQ